MEHSTEEPPAVPGAVPPPLQLTSALPAIPSNLASQHLAIQHFQQLQTQQPLQLQDFWANQIAEIEKTADFRNHTLPLARIKKIMKLDDSVRMIATETPVVFAKACELFILELSSRSWIHTEENRRRTLQRNDISAAVTRSDTFDFLVDTVPREEFKDEAPRIAIAALPSVNAQADSNAYYYVPATPVSGAAMVMGLPIDQTAAATLYAIQQPNTVAYMWQQPQEQEQEQQSQQDSDVE